MKEGRSRAKGGAVNVTQMRASALVFHARVPQVGKLCALVVRVSLGVLPMNAAWRRSEI